MKRRALLAAVGTGALAGCSDLVSVGRADPTDTGRWSVTDDHPSLTLRVSPDPVRLGESVTCEVTNESDEAVTLGCNVPWDLQRADGDDWERVAWTGERYYQMCFYELEAGDTYEESITLTKASLGERTSGAESSLRPGRYRLVLVGGHAPHAVTSFEVYDAE